MSAAQQIYCIVRKAWVAAQPEELVRQHLLAHMVHRLSYPMGNLVLEKELRQMPHLIGREGNVPNRRADIICFAKGNHPDHSLYPLLLVECKAVKLTSKVIDQVVGYNHYLGACFIAIANGQEIKTGWYDGEKNEYTFIDTLPDYSTLATKAERCSTTK